MSSNKENEDLMPRSEVDEFMRNNMPDFEPRRVLFEVMIARPMGTGKGTMTDLYRMMMMT